MIDNKNMILAIVLSIAILVGFQVYFDATRPPPPAPVQTTADRTQPPTAGIVPPPAGQAAIPTPMSGDIQVPSNVPTAGLLASVTRSDILAKNNRVSINTPRLHGSIALTGGRIDDLTLADYRETLDPKSPEIILLSPKGVTGAYYAQFGWGGAAGVKVPDQNTLWQADSKMLTPQRPVTLSWDNGQGLKFSRIYGVDKNYLFTITQKVENTATSPVSLYPYGLVSRRGTPKTSNFYILHEGMLGVTDGTLTEIKYDDIKDKKSVRQSGIGGWIGITDKYWLTALVPDQKLKTSTRFQYTKEGLVDLYQVDYVGPSQSVAAHGSIDSVNRFFAGAKEVPLLDKYSEENGVDRFDLAIDFGWFYFLTKPMFYALLWLNKHVLNLGIAILLLTVSIKLVLFPLANKSYTSMSKMKKLAPEMTRLRERYGEDKMKLNQEMMALYKKEKVNPASGCLPIVVQIPVFFALYKVLYVTIEMRHAPFFGWIQDLSAPDPTSVFNLFGLIPFTPPDFMMIGIWPLIMGITMFLQQKLNPQPTDPIQAKIFLFLPLMFTFMLARFPAGLVIYWAWNNSLSMLQQWIIMRRMGLTGKQALQ